MKFRVATAENVVVVIRSKAIAKNCVIRIGIRVKKLLVASVVVVLGVRLESCFVISLILRFEWVLNRFLKFLPLTCFLNLPTQLKSSIAVFKVVKRVTLTPFAIKNFNPFFH